MGGILARSLEASKRVRKLLLFVAALYTGSFLAGYWMIHTRAPLAIELRESMMQAVATEQPFTIVLEALTGGQLTLAILLTFTINLVAGAFLYTTLPGVVPLLGGLGTVAITIWRGFVIGITYYELFNVSAAVTVVAVGTLILELGGYVFSGAAGINISLSSIFPRRYQVDNRWKAFQKAWKDAGRVYVLVAVLLILGALWEIGGLFLLLS